MLEAPFEAILHLPWPHPERERENGSSGHTTAVGRRRRI